MTAKQGMLAVSSTKRNTGFMNSIGRGVHLAALVMRLRLAHEGRLTVQHGREAVDDGLGGRVVHLGEQHEAGSALDQRTDQGTVAGAFDQVVLPVAGMARSPISGGRMATLALQASMPSLRLGSRPIVLGERQSRLAMARMEHRSARMVMATARSNACRFLAWQRLTAKGVAPGF